MASQPVARLEGLSLHYRDTVALSDISLSIPSGLMAGLIGPDGVGKSSLLSLIAGARAIQDGEVYVLGGSMASRRHRQSVCPRIAYMPQGLGKNLYSTLSVFENIDFFGRLFGHGAVERRRRIGHLLAATGLAPFADRPAGKLSGGMKQKLGLCCALIHDPDLLVLDEPTTGVDPLSRRQFWTLIDSIRAQRPGMSVLVATAYMEEAAGFDWLAAMNQGQVLAEGSPAQLLAETGTDSLEQAFIALLPCEHRERYRPVEIPPRTPSENSTVAIEADGLTMRFGDFTAVDRVSFRIEQGEIFGFLGSNGCGKTTTMKMLTGLLPGSEGSARLFGREVNPRDLDVRRRVGYMTQGFSLYNELSVRQNLDLHARLFGLDKALIPDRVQAMIDRFELLSVADSLPDALPLGLRQRLQLAVALIHGPEILILDEPTSGVDPVARDAFWQVLVDLARKDGVTIFISTHFMNEAARCDRISLMHAGRVLVTGSPAELTAEAGTESLEAAFIHYLERAVSDQQGQLVPPKPVSPPVSASDAEPGISVRNDKPFSLRRVFSCMLRESLELRRDPIRLTMALLGTVILMFVVGYGISMDVDDLRFAVLDRDQTTTSRDYILNLSGSRYFLEQPALSGYEEMDKRMRSGDISLAIEIPPGFARHLARGEPVEVGAWIDGAMPTRAENIRGYVEGIHYHWLAEKSRQVLGVDALAGAASVETRFRYNPDVESLPAMVPAVIPMLLMLIPAILTALSVVREKELGSIINLYVTPVRRLEFLLGKQIAYVSLAMASFALLLIAAVWVFQVPLKGSLAALSLGALLYVGCATAFGLVVSTFTRSQTAALFGTAVLTIIPAVQFSGMIDPVSSLEGSAAWIGRIYPTTHFLTIARGTFSKGLGFGDLRMAFVALGIALPLLVTLGALLLRKQER